MKSKNNLTELQKREVMNQLMFNLPATNLTPRELREKLLNIKTKIK
jgi:hypothetical protein